MTDRRSSSVRIRRRIGDERFAALVRLVLLALVACACIAAFFLAGVDWASVNGLLLELRGRRVAALALVGIAVAVSTVAFQTIAGNRILTPSIMGLDSLYVLVQTVVVFTLGVGFTQKIGVHARFALTAGLMVVFAFVLVVTMMNRPVNLLILVGIVLGTLLRSCATFLQSVMEPNSLTVLQNQLYASFNTVDFDLLKISAVLVLVICIDLVRRSRSLDVLALGRLTAISLGLPYRRLAAAVLVEVSVLVAVVTALVGPVTFFGLLVAALAHRLAGTHRHRWVMAFAAVVGVISLVGGQAVLEFVLETNGLLSGVVEFVGGVLFILMLLAQRKVRP